jgi:hypothetical protein
LRPHHGAHEAGDEHPAGPRITVGSAALAVLGEHEVRDQRLVSEGPVVARGEGDVVGCEDDLAGVAVQDVACEVPVAGWARSRPISGCQGARWPTSLDVFTSLDGFGAAGGDWRAA